MSCARGEEVPARLMQLRLDRCEAGDDADEALAA
jgi:hypothetical protein